ncbi:Uncharacterised protein [Salmonella enterica subsp. enterica serovar Sanjuan]|uniref:Uncharacterized protein n=1 Tax=Salmonella enterica subsp. enterica serovar Sanjuan TaxID=1160765 RepID=A0A447NFD6_SALET|nr:Uncharacterised protein [Salmonella enterica subsp. enterica serovar Sanjuan]
MALCLNLFVRKPGNHQHHLPIDPLFQHCMRNTQGLLLLTLMYALLLCLVARLHAYLFCAPIHVFCLRSSLISPCVGEHDAPPRG